MSFLGDLVHGIKGTKKNFQFVFLFKKPLPNDEKHMKKLNEACKFLLETSRGGFLGFCKSISVGSLEGKNNKAMDGCGVRCFDIISGSKESIAMAGTHIVMQLKERGITAELNADGTGFLPEGELK